MRSSNAQGSQLAVAQFDRRHPSHVAAAHLLRRLLKEETLRRSQTEEWTSVLLAVGCCAWEVSFGRTRSTIRASMTECLPHTTRPSHTSVLHCCDVHTKLLVRPQSIVALHAALLLQEWMVEELLKTHPLIHLPLQQPPYQILTLRTHLHTGWPADLLSLYAVEQLYVILTSVGHPSHYHLVQYGSRRSTSLPWRRMLGT